jgi:hypothetical protein
MLYLFFTFMSLYLTVLHVLHHITLPHCTIDPPRLRFILVPVLLCPKLTRLFLNLSSIALVSAYKILLLLNSLLAYALKPS